MGVTVDIDAGAYRRYSQTAESSTLSRSAEQFTNLAANHYLINASIEKTQQTGGWNYAIAVIPITETSLILRNLIEENDAIITEYLEIARQESDPIYQYSFVNMARLIAQENDTYRNQLSVISPVVSITAEHSGGSLLAEEQKILRSITFQVSLNDRADALFSDTIKATLNSLGMRTVQRNPAYIIRAQSPVLTDLPARQEKKFMQARYHLQMEDGDGAELNSFSFERTIIYSGNREQGIAQAYRLLLLEIEENFPQLFDGFLNELLLE